MNSQFRVYVSCPIPENLSPEQQSIRRAVLDQLVRAGYHPLNLDGYWHPDHTEANRPLDIRMSWEGMQRLMADCQGAVVLAFAQTPVLDDSGQRVGSRPTEFNHIEGSIAIAQRLPLLILAERGVVPRGIVWEGGGLPITYIPQGSSPAWLDSPSFQQPFGAWRKQVDAQRHLFLGYCSAASAVADQIIAFLEDQQIRVLDWHRDFTAAETVLEQIEQAARRCLGGVFLFTHDDTMTHGAETRAVPRDNVIFETGYFIRAKGKRRTLIIREGDAKIPADIGGDIFVPLDDRSDISSIKQALMIFVRERIA